MRSTTQRFSHSQPASLPRPPFQADSLANTAAAILFEVFPGKITALGGGGVTVLLQPQGAACTQQTLPWEAISGLKDSLHLEQPLIARELLRSLHTACRLPEEPDVVAAFTHTIIGRVLKINRGGAQIRWWYAGNSVDFHDTLTLLSKPALTKVEEGLELCRTFELLFKK